jgi:hypothetical protein
MRNIHRLAIVAFIALACVIGLHVATGAAATGAIVSLLNAWPRKKVDQ